MTDAGRKSKSRIPWIVYIGGTEKRGCASSSRQRHAFKPTSSFCMDLILATATAGNLVHMVTFSSYSSIFAPSSTGLISLSGKNTERQNGSRMYPTHRPLSRHHCVEATSQYMHYIKLGVLHSFRVNCISGWQFGKVADNGVSNNNLRNYLRNCILGYTDKHQQTDIHRLVSYCYWFSRSGNGGGGHSRDKKEISTTKC